MDDEILAEVQKLNLIQYVKESNQLSGIYREPADKEVNAFELFIGLLKPSIQDCIDFIQTWWPGARIRDFEDIHSIMLGDYIAPPSGAHIMHTMYRLLLELPTSDRYKTHMTLCKLLPFSAANGMVARAIWAWQAILDTGGLHNGFFMDFYQKAIKADEINSIELIGLKR